MERKTNNSNKRIAINSLTSLLSAVCLCGIVLSIFGTICLIRILLSNTSKVIEENQITVVTTIAIQEYDQPEMAEETTATYEDVSTIDDTMETSVITEQDIANRSRSIDGVIYDDSVKPSDLEFMKYIDDEVTDLDDDQLEYIVKIGNENHINPYLIAAIIYTESRGHSDVYNSGGYRGYGGIGNEFGSHIYENFLGMGEYDHDMAFDPYTNILIIGSGLNYLMSEDGYNYDIYDALQFYSGTGDDWWYINKCSERLEETGGPTLDEIYQEYLNNQEV